MSHGVENCLGVVDFLSGVGPGVVDCRFPAGLVLDPVTLKLDGGNLLLPSFLVGVVFLYRSADFLLPFVDSTLGVVGFLLGVVGPLKTASSDFLGVVCFSKGRFLASNIGNFLAKNVLGVVVLLHSEDLMAKVPGVILFSDTVDSSSIVRPSEGTISGVINGTFIL